MRLPVRLLILALGAGLVVAGTAQAGPLDPPEFTAPPFTKAVAGAGNAVQMTFNYTGPTLPNPTPQDHAEVSATEPGGTPSPVTGPAASGSIPLFVTDGHLYNLEVSVCQAASCSMIAHAPATGQTRIDATPPSGTVQINGGAAATNSRNVTLNLAATDPLIDGIPGSSSGIAQVAVDNDGDGTFPCSFIIIGTPDTSGCARDFARPSRRRCRRRRGQDRRGRVRRRRAPITAPCRPSSARSCSAPRSSATPRPRPRTRSSWRRPSRSPRPRWTGPRSSAGRRWASTLGLHGPEPGHRLRRGSHDRGLGLQGRHAAATGQRVTHVFATAATFIGQVTVKDRAGNVSDPGRSRSRSPRGPATPPRRRSGSVGAITSQGTAAFRIDRVKVNARYSKSKLKGSITLVGTSAQAGTLRADLRPTTKGGKVRHLAGRVALGAFSTTLKLPADLLPGTYKLDFVGPGGTLNSSLKLTAPKEGVLKSGKVSGSPRRAVVLFTLAAQPAKALRGRLTVSWLQGRARSAWSR